MSVKSAKFRASLYFTLAAFGVCSVSLECFAFSDNSSDSVPFSRPTRDTPKKTQKSTNDDSPPVTPFSPGSQNLSLGVGQVFLLGDLGNVYDSALGPEVHYDYGVSDMFAFESNFGYHSHTNGELSVWNLNAGVRANLMYFDQLIPYVTVGLGFYHPSFTLANNATVSSLLFGMQLGAGIDLMMTKQLFFGTSLTYNDMFDSSKKDSNGNNQSLGGSFISFMIHLGITF